MLEVRQLTKSYGSTSVLRGVDLSAERGELVGVLGGNGAGKSTLLKILAGIVRPDSGTVLIDGVAKHLTSPAEALRAGVALVPQELAFLPDLTVAENILLGQWPRVRGVISRRSMNARAAELAELVGLNADVARPMRSLSMANAQLVEIAKALSRRSELLLLDEPTAALTDAESAQLFSNVKRLLSERVAVVLISHRLDEVLEHADRVVVLRDGRVTADRPTASTTKSEVVTAMVGEVEPARRRTAPGRSDAAPALALVGVSQRGSGGVADIDLDVMPGEIVGVFSVRGGGQEALVAAITGSSPHDEGTITVHGRRRTAFRSPRAARRAGIAFVPADRKHDGLVLSASIVKNLSLPNLGSVARGGLISARRERALMAELVARFVLRYRDRRQPVGELSGGNQQKVLVASRIASRSALVVMHEPTRGVDVAARREIHARLDDLAAAGASVLIATTDTEEAVTLSDRLFILRGGRVVAELSGRRKTVPAALELAAG